MLTRRAWLLGASAGVGAIVGRSCVPTNAPGPAFPAAPTGSGVVLDDASQLSPTRVTSHLTIREDPRSAAVDRLRAALAEARAAGRPFIASAARHSMGGQGLAKDGTVITLDQQWLEPDTAKQLYRVAAGERWSSVISRLDAIGFSPKVMQSNNDFGVASTFSVNAHGWPVPFSGCGSTVRAIAMLLADGSAVTCSRTENAELFQHAMGGYGLFGVITELELDMVPNARLVPSFERVNGADIGTRLAAVLSSDKTIQMAYGRMDISLDRFFDEGLIITYRPSTNQSALPAASGSGFVSRASRYLFRAQVESDRAKHFRWWNESSLGPMVAGEATRNTLMNEPGDARRPRSIPHRHPARVLRRSGALCRVRHRVPGGHPGVVSAAPQHHAALRGHRPRQRTGLCPEPRIAAVMLFSQEKTVRGEADMARMTHALIERVLAIGGTYYLPYRPHASLDQLTRGYPRAAAFVAKKREVDRGVLFRNRLWDGYFARL